MSDLYKISSYSFDKLNSRESIRKIISSAIKAVDPYQSVKTNLEKHFSKEKGINGRGRRVFIISFGKASVPMTQAAIDYFRNEDITGVAVTKHSDYSKINGIEIIRSSHPIPDHTSINAAKNIIKILSSSKEDDVTIFLISGGGSSLVAFPPPQIKLIDIKKITSLLLDSGATINEINCIRRHIDTIKGGGLVNFCKSRRIFSFIISDVIGNQLEDIASGPTSIDPSTFIDAWGIISKYGISESSPRSIVDYLLKGINGDIPETLKSIDPRTNHIDNIIIGCNKDAAQAAVTQARMVGFQSKVITTSLIGEASKAGQWLAHQIIESNKSKSSVSPICWVAGGETTVKIKGKGIGGRNLEVALGAVKPLSSQKSSVLITFATDGEDGKSYSAGAIVTGDTYLRSLGAGLSIEKSLQNNDSHNFFDKLGDLFITGPTQTNVNDLDFLFMGIQ